MSSWLRVTDEKFSELQLWQMLHESVFDAVQPAEEPYDENLHFSVSQDGKITPDISDASDGLACRSFENATIDFTTPATFKVSCVRIDVCALLTKTDAQEFPAPVF